MVLLEQDVKMLAPEAVTDAAGLSRLHAAVYESAIPDLDGNVRLEHEDDPNFRFAVGYIGTTQVIRLGEDSVTALGYVINAGAGTVEQAVFRDDRKPVPGEDISEKTAEIAALAHVIARGSLRVVSPS